MLVLTTKKTLKAVLLYCAIFAVVALVAAFIGCLLLHDGRTVYLLDPEKLLWYAWTKRSGLKVQIFFVTMILWWMMMLDGALGRPWRRTLTAWLPRSQANLPNASSAAIRAPVRSGFQGGAVDQQAPLAVEVVDPVVQREPVVLHHGLSRLSVQAAGKRRPRHVAVEELDQRWALRLAPVEDARRKHAV